MTYVKYSVIVPVYKTEKTLSACLDSLLNQTAGEVEVVLVNDASPDGSLAVCREYAARDPRVVLVDKPVNEGLGKARESGLSAASGEWVLFVDSDDLIERNTLEELEKVLSDKTDIAVFGMTLFYENAVGKTEWEEKLVPQKREAYTPERLGALPVLLERERVFPYMCNKAYRRTLLAEKGASFNSVKSMEDFFYNIEIFRFARGVTCVPEAFYRYRKPATETLASAYNEEFFSLSEKRYLAFLDFLKRFDAETEETRYAADLSHFKHLLSCLIRDGADNSPLKGKERRQKAREYLSSPVTREMLLRFRPASLALRLVATLLRKRCYRTAVLLGTFGNLSQSTLKKQRRKIK